MNIFYLDRDPYTAARAQCDRHNPKMILETAQLLSTAHIVLDGEHVAYRATHQNHPCAVWVRSSARHYRWAHQHMMELGREYTRRYGKLHKTIREYGKILETLPVSLDPMFGAFDHGFTDPPQCMPDECKRDDTVEAYNNYYMHKAREWASAGRPMKWNRRHQMPVHFQKQSA